MKIETKYNGLIDFDLYKEHAVKNIFKILPLKEEGKDWEKYLTGLLVELNGFHSLNENINFISLVARLEGLFIIPNNDMGLFRKTVFDCIDLLKKISPKKVE